MAHKPPAARGERVRVVQKWAGDDPSCCEQAQEIDIGVHGGGGGHGHGGHGGGGHAGKSGGRPSHSASLNIRDARVLLVAAAAFTVILAATEGSRFNGWVKLRPEQPVHLLGPHGEHARVAVQDIDPQTAAWARKAWIRPEEGQVRRLKRTPLRRRGFTWSMLAGAATIDGANGAEPGFMSHLQLGGFPSQKLGVVGDLGIGWRDADTDDAVYQIQGGIELQAYPFVAGRVHAGGYGQLGGVARSDDGAGRDNASSLVSAGGLLQLDLTTYLAMTARAGLTWAFDERTSDFTVGLSIY